MQQTSPSSPGRILVADDDHRVRVVHARILEEAGFVVETAADGVEAVAKLALDIDLALLDNEMPRMDGFEVAARIRGDEKYGMVPIMMVTGMTSPRERRRAMEAGINDFLDKPADPDILALRCRWLVELKRAYDRLDDHNVELQDAVEHRTAALRHALEEVTEARRLTHTAHLDTIQRLTVAAEYRDSDTAGHIERIGLYAEVMGRAVGLGAAEVERLRHAAPMHDVGKLAIPDHILLKPGKLDEAEWEVMRTHTTKGAELLAGSPSPLLQLGERIALTHHERWDGTGYPNGLRGEDIPIEGRLCAVVDFFDALTMQRPYRKAVPVGEVYRMMDEASGSHFDPYVHKTFTQQRAKIAEVRAVALERVGAGLSGA
jgi:putative two-component system response regulator